MQAGRAGVTNHLRQLLLLVVATTFTLSLYGQVVGQNTYQIRLKTRTFVPQVGITDQTISNLERSVTTEKKNPHILIQFKTPLSRADREMLGINGIRVLSSVGGNAWYATVTDMSLIRSKDSWVGARQSLLTKIRWIGEIPRQDKIASFLKTKGPGSWAKNSDGTIKLSVEFFEDVTRETARAILAKHGVAIESERTRRTSFHVVLNPALQDSLLDEDNVKFVDIYPPPKTVFNDGSRAWTHTDAVHTHAAKSDAAVHIQGNGVVLGIWDANEVDDAHQDLAGRVTFGENPRTNSTSEHSTHVAGTMAGNGTITFNLRGHAPAAQIVSYDFSDDVAAEMEDALRNHAIVCANNSWGYVVGWDAGSGTWLFWDNQDIFGDYADICTDFDDLARDERLLAVFAIGNDRNDPTNGTGTSAAKPADWDQGSGNNGYATIAPPSTAKNVITVGAIDDANSNMAEFSNWGPTDDGRTKPDLVAPGVSIRSCDDDANNNAAGDVNNQYVVMSGTSMAAPAVTGISALLIQTYRDEFFGNVNSTEVPLPSTIKGILIHTATDLGNPGPDFRFGWGGVNAEAAYNVMRNRLLLESQLADGEENVFLCDVPANTSTFHATICWDDVSGSTLKNDLDLLLEAPDGTAHLPWVLDPTPANWANNATHGVDRVNNVEQVAVNNPMAGQWKIKVSGHRVNEPIGNPFQKYSLVSDFTLYQAQNVSVVQVIDRTGSMSHRDATAMPTYMESAKTAAQNFIGLMQLGDEVGVVSFDDPDCDYQNGTAEARFSLAALASEATRSTAIASIDALAPRGCTSIAAGLQLAQFGPNFLNIASADNPHAIVLLSDGYENTTPPVSVVLPTIPAKTDIYTIALGPSADDALLQEIATQTNGKFYESPTILGLLSIYLQIQGQVELGEMADLAVGSKSSGNDTRKVLIDAGASEATFVVGWLQNQGRLKMTLVNPQGATVTQGQSGVRQGTGKTFSFWKIRNPIPGEWEVHILRDDPGSFSVDYTFAAFARDVSKLWSFVPSIEDAGSCLATKVHLYDNRTSKPITGATVEAVVTSPRKSIYSIYYDYAKPTAAQWQPSAVYAQRLMTVVGKPVPAPAERLPVFVETLERYNVESIQSTGQSIFQYDTRTYMLYDDGTHGDGLANDGIYAFCIPHTDIAGSYSISFKISGVSTSGAKFARQMLETAIVKPGVVDPAKVMVRIDPRTIPVTGGSEGIVSVVPIDRFGNVLGPGQASRIAISSSAGTLSGKLIDNGDGFYFQKIVSAGKEETGQISVKVDGVTAASQATYAIGPVWKKLGLSLHSGIAIPRGDFADVFKPGVNGLLDISYRFSQSWALVGFLGYNNFVSKVTGVDNNRVWNISLNLRHYLNFSTTPGYAWSYYVGAGPGLYVPNMGDSKFGFNIGAGVNWAINPMVTGEVGVDYHRTFDTIEFIHSHVGVIFSFW
jgi:hypothetical protein